MLDLVPLRDEGPNKISTIIYHYSYKLQRQVWCESNLEWNVAILLDHDKSVKTYVEQGIEIKRKSGSSWTPDFVVLFEDGTKLIIEVKYLEKLLDPEENDDFIEKYDEAEIWAKKNGYEFIVVTDKIVNQDARINNCRKLMEAQPDFETILEIKPIIEKIVDGNPGTNIGSVISHFEEYNETINSDIDEVVEVLYDMLYQDFFELDFTERITSSTMLFLHKNKENVVVESLNTWFRTEDWKKQVIEPTKTVPLEDLYGIPKKHLEIAKERYHTIEPLIFKATREEVKTRADQCGVSVPTIWRWLRRYRENMDIRSLVPRYKSRGRQEQYDDELIRVGIDHYLQMVRPKITEAYDVLCAKAMEKKIKPPSYETFRRKIDDYDREEKIKKRRGRRERDRQYHQSNDPFPHAEWALQTVQIDHTPIDVIVVDEEHRLEVGKPYITVAFDVYSRVVLGYTVTFDKPSRLSIAMALINCISDKEKTLKLVREYYGHLFSDEELKVVEDNAWKNVKGLPRTLHMDNGSDFTSKDVRLFGLGYNIHLQYRPVEGARYGGHVERFLGTLNGRLHSLEGSTFSNIQEKGDYDSESKAIYTLGELNALIVMELAKYHIDFHSTIKTTPIARWNESFTHHNPLRSPGHNIPENLEKFYFDVLPSELRVVQQEGISLFGIYYNDAKIRKWIKNKNPNTENGKFRIRFDPRDIREVYFYDPDNKEYITLAATDYYLKRYFSDQPLLLWEYKASNKEIEGQGYKNVRTKQKLQIVSMQQKIKEDTKKKAKTVRQKKAKDRNRKRQKERQFSVVNSKQNKQQHEQDVDEIPDEEIRPYEPIESINSQIDEENLDDEEDEIEVYETEPEKIREGYIGKWSGKETED